MADCVNGLTLTARIVRDDLAVKVRSILCVVVVIASLMDGSRQLLSLRVLLVFMEVEAGIQTNSPR